jgi:SAM-dependent methyltransferase
MHERSARWLDLLDVERDHGDDARRIAWLLEAATPNLVETVLDVGCGTGRHLAHLREEFRVEGLDISPEVLSAAAGRLPGVPLHRADLTAFDLGRRFDALTCLGSAVAYATTIPLLRRTLAGFARHLNRGGVALVAPWVFRDDWLDGHVETEAVDQGGVALTRTTRFDRVGAVSRLAVDYVVRTAAGVEGFSERHELGLFTDAEYRAAFAAAGLLVSFVPNGLADGGVYVALRPPSE